MRIIQVVGPTACGKTNFSVALGAALGAEMLNVDSMQVYKDLAIGTDKPSPAQQAELPIHGIDLIPLGPPLDAAAFAAYADQKLAEIAARNKPALISGGTGLYHRTIIHGILQAPSRDDALRERLRAERDQIGQPAMFDKLRTIDPEAADKIMPTDWVRIERALEVFELTGRKLSEQQVEHGFKETRYERLCLGCWRPREELYANIEKRLDEMWATGIVDETRKLLEAGLPADELPVKALGYKQAAAALNGVCSFEQALDDAKRETRRFAKRQLTWFRADKETHWVRMPLDMNEFAAVCRACRAFLAGEVPDFTGVPLVQE